MKRFLLISLIASMAIGGCGKPVAKEQVEPVPTSREVTVYPAVMPTVDALGGSEAWSKTEAIVGECTVKVYNPDRTFYLTTQRHAVYPWADSIRVYAPEPQGTFVWQLTGVEFILLEGDLSKAEKLPLKLCDPYIARTLWCLIASPAAASTLAAAPESGFESPSSIDGKWYNPYKLTDEITLYRNSDNNIFEAIHLVNSANNISLLARGYDYIPIKETDIVAPTKIEILNADQNGNPIERVMEMDYHRWESFGIKTPASPFN